MICSRPSGKGLSNSPASGKVFLFETTLRKHTQFCVVITLRYLRNATEFWKSMFTLYCETIALTTYADTASDRRQQTNLGDPSGVSTVIRKVTIQSCNFKSNLSG